MVAALSVCAVMGARADLLVSNVGNAGPPFGGPTVKRYDETTGAFIANVFPAFAGGNPPTGLVLGPDGNLYVGDGTAHSVKRFNPRTGVLLGDFVAPGSGGLGSPQGLVFGPDGNLYVSDPATHNVLRYSGTTGAFIDVFVAGSLIGTGGVLVSPFDLLFGPDGNLYVSNSAGHNVMRYHGATGAPLPASGQPGAIFASGGGLIGPAGLAFGPDGNLYVSDADIHRVKRFQGPPGATPGTFVDDFVSFASGGLNAPRGLRLGQDGSLYVASFGSDHVKRYQGPTGVVPGAFIDNFASGSGLDAPIFLIFGATNRRPAVTCPEPVSFECDSPLGATVTVQVHVTDPDGDTLVVQWYVDGSPVRTDTGVAPNSTPSFTRAYTRGVHLVEVSVFDGLATDQCGTTVTVTDTTPPVILCAENVTVSTDPGRSYASNVVLPPPTVSDNCEVASMVNDHPSNVYPCGVTAVTWTVTDVAGNQGQCVQLVIVEDREPPAITCPPDVSVANDPGQSSAVVNPGIAAASDNCDGARTAAGQRSDGKPLSAPYPVGQTTVTWVATDSSGNVATCMQTVTVRDVEKPTITCPSNLTVPRDSAAGATVTYTVAAADNSPGVTVSCSPASGTVFPPGTTTVTCTATDAAGNQSVCTFTVTVVSRPDLTGSWSRLSQNGSGRDLKGILLAHNAGRSTSGKTQVRFFLSPDNTLDAGDTLLKASPLAALRPGTTKKVSLNAKVPAGQSASGKFVIAVLDPLNAVTESDENNNRIVFGPIPPGTGVQAPPGR